MGTIVDDEDLLHIVLKGLSSEYESFSSTMLTKSEYVPFEELHVLMVTQEEFLKSSEENSKENSIMAMAANKGPQFNNNTQFNNNAQFNNSNSKGGFNNRDRGGFNNCGRGNNKGGFSPRGGYNQNQVSYTPNTSSYPQQLNPNFPNPNPNCPTCQICYKPSHTTIDCYNRINYSYQGRHPPAKLAAMASATPSSSPNCWISDIGAIDHFTLDLANLPDSSIYNDSQLISVGNSQ